MKKVSLQDKLLSMLYGIDPVVERVRARPGAITLENIAKHVALGTACGSQGKHFEDCSDSDVSSLDESRVSDDAEAQATVGTVRHVVMSGGSHSRLGKSLLDPLPVAGVSLTAHTNMQSHPSIETWMMVSPSMFRAWADYLGALVPTPDCTIFEQFESHALDPMFNLLPGTVGLRPSGTGDVYAALSESGLLSDNPGVKHIIMSHGNNLVPSPNMLLLQRHISTGSLVTCEVTKEPINSKYVSPDAPFLAWHAGSLSLLGPEHMPDDGAERWRATGTFIVDRTVVESKQMQLLDAYGLVRKTHSGHVVFQLERHAWEVVNLFPTSFVAGQCAHVWSADTWSYADKLLRMR